MAIFVDQNTKVIVQGLTGGQGRYHGLRNKAYGTQVVGGVTPGKAGQDVEGIPVFDTVADAVAATGATASFIAVPPKAAPAAILEAARAGIGFVVCITEGVPAQDEARVFATLQRDYPATRLLGPNCPGIISPGKCNIGITAGEIAQLPTSSGPNVGIVSRSGTLTYQALYELKQHVQVSDSSYVLPKAFQRKMKRVCLQHCSATTQQHDCLAQTVQELLAQANATSELLPARLHKYQPRRGQTLASFHDRERLHIRRCTN